MDQKKLFDAIRKIKGEALTQQDVDSINIALRAPDPLVSSSPTSQLILALKNDEGLRLKAYQDTEGVWTIGYGHAFVKPDLVITRAQAEEWLLEDAAKHNDALHQALPWVLGLDQVRADVLRNMAFNLGIAKLLMFKNTLEFVRTGQWEKAAGGMLSSKWAKQVGKRAKRLAVEMTLGTYQPLT